MPLPTTTKRISDLDELVSPSNADVLLIESAIETSKITIANLRASMQANLVAGVIVYDNSVSGLAATNLQAAIDELAANPGITDHGDLDGLGDDDHTQYLLVDGTRPMSGGLGLVDGSLAAPAVHFASSPTTGIFSPESLAPGVPGVLFVVDGAFAGGFLQQGAGVQFRSNAGSLAVPAVAIDQATTGFHSPGGGALAVGSNGVEVVRFEAPSGANPQMVLPVGTAAKPSIVFTGTTSGFYSSLSQVLFVYGGSQRWAFGSNTFHATGTGASSILAQAVNSYLTIGGRQDQKTSANPSLRVAQYANLPFAGANIQQTMMEVVSVLNQSGTSGFTALAIDVTETATGSGTRSLIRARSGTSGTTEVFAVRTNGNVETSGTVDGRDVAADGAKLDLITAGTYSPTFTGSDGSILASTTYGNWHYIRVGNHVHVTGLVTINTASVASFPYPYLEFTLPVATASASIGFLAGVFASDLPGAAAGSSIAGRVQGTVSGVSAKGRMVFVGTTSDTDQEYAVSFTYEIAS